MNIDRCIPAIGAAAWRKTLCIYLVIAPFIMFGAPLRTSAQEQPEAAAQAGEQADKGAVKQDTEDAKDAEESKKKKKKDAEVETPLDENQNQAFVYIVHYARTERAYAEHVCKLNQAQKETLDQLDKKWANAQVRELIKARGNGAFGGFFGGPTTANTSAVIRKLQKLVDEKIVEALTEEQRRRLKEEKDARDAFRREADADAALLLLSRYIELTDDQREKLRPALAESFSAKSYAWQWYLGTTEYMPYLRRSTLRKYLTKEQMDTIRAIQVQNMEAVQMEVQMMGGFQWAAGVEEDL